MKRGSPLRRLTPLKARTPLKSTARLVTRTPLRQRSNKRAEQMAVYVPERNAFLTANPLCQYPEGCGQRATQVHHKRGRFGVRLLDQTWWAASCDTHNQEAETNTGHCLTIGWLVRIEGDD